MRTGKSQTSCSPPSHFLHASRYLLHTTRSSGSTFVCSYRHSSTSRKRGLPAHGLAMKLHPEFGFFSAAMEELFVSLPPNGSSHPMHFLLSSAGFALKL